MTRSSRGFECGTATPATLGNDLAGWVTERTEAILTRHFAGPVLPRFQAGHIIDSAATVAVGFTVRGG